MAILTKGHNYGLAWEQMLWLEVMFGGRKIYDVATSIREG